MRRTLAAWSFGALDLAVPVRSAVVLHSQPDLDDNVVGLLRERPDAVAVSVLVDDATRAAGRARALGLEVRLVPRRSARGLWAYLRARVSITTHGLYGSRRRRGRHTVNLWHGEFGKLIGDLVGEPRRHADWMPVSGGVSRLLRSAEFGLPLSSIAVVGTPRQGLLQHRSDGPLVGRHVVWAPTYRRTEQGRERQDGSSEALAADNGPDNPRLVEVLQQHGATLWFRPHPADLGPGLATSTEVVRSADDAALESEGLTFYELLSMAEVLITDYSSLWVDWLLTNRPALSFCPDLEQYRAGRGIVLEPHEAWFPGPVVTTPDALAHELDGVLQGEDPYAGRRADLRSQLHAVHAESPASAVWAHVAEIARTGAR